MSDWQEWEAPLGGAPWRIEGYEPEQRSLGLDSRRLSVNAVPTGGISVLGVGQLGGIQLASGASTAVGEIMVVNPGGLDEVALRVEAHGVDPRTVTVVRLPFEDVPVVGYTEWHVNGDGELAPGA